MRHRACCITASLGSGPDCIENFDGGDFYNDGKALAKKYNK
jgi:hypothetical protein